MRKATELHDSEPGKAYRKPEVRFISAGFGDAAAATWVVALMLPGYSSECKRAHQTTLSIHFRAFLRADFRPLACRCSSASGGSNMWLLVLQRV